MDEAWYAWPQEAHVREWVENRTHFPSDFQIVFYQGRYDPAFCSIFPVGDLTHCVPDDEVSAPAIDSLCPALLKCSAEKQYSNVGLLAPELHCSAGQLGDAFM